MVKSAPTSLKIGFVLDGGLERPDGVQQYILTLGEWYKSLGHSVRYIVAGPIAPGISGAVSLSRSLHVKSNGNRLSIPWPANKKELSAYLKKERFDVLHVQTPYSPLMGGKLISLSPRRTAVIGTFHVLPSAWIFSFGNRLLGLWCRRTLKRFDEMFSVSPAAQAFCQKTFKTSSIVLPNVVDVERFRKAQPFNRYKDNELTILFLGRLVPRKGCQLLLAAVKELIERRQSLPDFRVIVAGSGPLEAKLKRYVSDNQLDSIVEFSGYVSEADKPSYYASADLAVFPSHSGESFGIVLIEAMAAGRAVVLAGRNPGYASVLAGQPQLLFDPSSAPDLADKLALYLSDHQDRQRMSDWCANYALEFDVNRVGQELIGHYRQALHNRAAP